MTKVNTIKRFNTKAGYSALIIKHREHLCGYVDVPSDHPWYGKDYSNETNIPLSAKAGSTNFLIEELIEVHGGITYADLNLETNDGWCFGFDCAHAGDTPEYWNAERVTEELERLAEQLKKYEISTDKE